MGTRSLTRVNDDRGQIICMYHQFDGYPSGHGKELFEFLDGMEIINGIPMDRPKKAANGVGCLSAQLVAFFKKEIGGIYLYPVSTTDAGQEYEYIIEIDDDYEISIKCIGYGELEFEGTVSEFGEFCMKEA